jgi:hypothetical protein
MIEIAAANFQDSRSDVDVDENRERGERNRGDRIGTGTTIALLLRFRRL